MAKEKGADPMFDNYENDTLTRPRDIAWEHWWKSEKVGDKVQGYIRDVFYRSAEGQFKEQRGITLEQPNGELINVAIKRIPFLLAKTDALRLGDPLTMVFEKQLPPKTKGYKGVKVYTFYGKNLDSTVGSKTVKELDLEDMALQKSLPAVSQDDGEEEDHNATFAAL